MNDIYRINEFHNKLIDLSDDYEIQEDVNDFHCTYTQVFSIYKEFFENKLLPDPFIGKFDLKLSIQYSGFTIAYKDFLRRSIPDDERVKLSFRINKEKNLFNSQNHYVFFQMENFIEVLTKDNFVDFLKKNNTKINIYTNLNKSTVLENDFITVSSIYDLKDSTEFKKSSIPITSMQDVNDFYNILKKHTEKNVSDILCPLPLYFNESNNNSLEIREAFSLLFIRNFLKSTCTQIVDDGYHFNGSQSIFILDSDVFSPTNIDEVLLLYNFVFDKNKYIDKKEIFIQVFTIYLDDNSTLQHFDHLSKKIRITVENHFTSYIQNHVENFFNKRKDVQMEAFKAGVDAKHQTDKIIQNINYLLLGLLTASLTTVFTFFRGETFIFILAIIGHVVYFVLTGLINILNFRHKKSDIEKSFNNYVSEFSSLIPDEVGKIKDSQLTPALNRLRNSFITYIVFTILINILMILLILVMLNYYNTSIAELLNILRESKNSL
ncbi:hypothetical protein HXA35_15705 [Bacillus sp. A301a_S52]|jgi:hypothetical protein|nr:hypothetical protein [Bacillus sp. A301a_S52]